MLNKRLMCNDVLLDELAEIFQKKNGSWTWREESSRASAGKLVTKLFMFSCLLAKIKIVTLAYLFIKRWTVCPPPDTSPQLKI